MKLNSWIEINKEALIDNITQLKKLLNKNTRFLAIVKGNAYGHGIEQVASVVKNQVDWLGVNSLDEALILKKSGVSKPILILGYTPISDLEEVVKNDFRQVVYNKETAKQLLKFSNYKPKIHLKIETGTNRQGAEGAELLEIANIFKQASSNIEGVFTQKIEIEGTSMHFATLEEDPPSHKASKGKEKAFYKEQLERFEKQLELLRQNGIIPKIIHSASTAAAILYPKTHFDMVRIGIGLYGLWPSDLVKKLADKRKIKLDLKPVLTWKARVVQIKEVAEGETIGYGRTYKVKNSIKIAILPVGYYDGYDRHLSNNGRVLISGRFAPVVGRVMMNMTIVDITKIKNVKLEDEVILIGKYGKHEITAEELAEKIGTINYEVVSRINPNLPRIII